MKIDPFWPFVASMLALMASMGPMLRSTRKNSACVSASWR